MRAAGAGFTGEDGEKPPVNGEKPSGDVEKLSRLRRWVLASRPRTLLAAVGPVAAGTGLAAAAGGFAALPALVALVGAILIQVGTNLSNDYHDFIRGTDTGDRVGPVRVTQAGILPPEAVLRGSWAAFGGAVMAGLYLVAVAGWPVVAIGILSILAGLAYTSGPFPLAYHGLGDLFVFLFFGWVAVGGTYYVQALDVRWDLLLAGAGVGALNTAILVANNVRDLETDARAGKRTLAVILGRDKSRVEYVVLVLVSAVVPPAGIFIFGWPLTALAALGGSVAAIPPARILLRGDAPGELRPALPGTARAAGLYGVLLGAGLALGG